MVTAIVRKLIPSENKQQMLAQMQHERALDARIKDMSQRNDERDKKNKSAVWFEDEDVNMAKRKAQSDGESDAEGIKRSKSERSRGRAAYDSPSNRKIEEKMRSNEHSSTDTKEKKGKASETTKGKGNKNKGKGKSKGEGKSKGKGKQRFFPAPDFEDPIVQMQNQLEICRLKGDRRITYEVSTKWFNAIKKWR